MKAHRWFRTGLTFFILVQIIASLTFPLKAFAVAPSQKSGEGVIAAEAGASPQAPLVDTFLSVEIVGSPSAILDSNPKPGESVPSVFLVEAKVTNAGLVPAAHVLVTLDYNADPANGWVLVPGEDPDRTIDQLDPGSSYFAYWFVRYSSTIGQTHQYTVTASAGNASSEFATGSITTISSLSTGNSGIVSYDYTVIVGTAFTVTVTYDLGSGPGSIIFSPVGNSDFDPGAYRLTATKTEFYNSSNALIEADFDKIFFTSTPAGATTSVVTYTFLALTASDITLCPYAAIAYSQNNKYDQFYCEAGKNTVVSIQGILTVSMLKKASREIVQQGQVIDYTINYTNTGNATLNYVWIWEDIDPAIGSIVPGSISPAPDPAETNSNRAAWYFNYLPPSGQAGSKGSMNFSVMIDGGGSNDLADGYVIVTNAHFGVNPGSLPQQSALTSTVTTTVQAPSITVQKTDNQQFVAPDDPYLYQIEVDNSGSVAAVGVVITDVLPAELTLAGTPNPVPVQNGQTLVWKYPVPLAPDGSPIRIFVPVKADRQTPGGTVISNTVSVKYQNPVGYAYHPQSATDTTTVISSADLTIAKTGFPNPVAPGTEITYTYTYTNNGPSIAQAVRITDTLPADVTFLGVISQPSSLQGPTINGQQLVWTAPALADQETGSVVFSGIVDPGLVAPQLISNTVIIQSPDSDQNPGNNQAIAYTVVGDPNNAAIYGVVFDDTNGNGLLDLGEHGIPGVVVTLDGLTQMTTSALGTYFFLTPDEGSHTIVETDPSGYHSTTPNEVLVDVLRGHGYQVDFGDVADTTSTTSIYGTVFDDRDGNGLRDAGEPGIPGVAVQLDGFEVQETDAYGNYTFAIAVDGLHTLVETDPAGYHSTTPNEVQLTVDAGHSYRVNFGDASNASTFASIYGTVFDDSNGNGSRDLGELGISGVMVTLDGSTSRTTGPFGAYTFTTTITGSHTLVETDPAGYHSTTSNEVQVDVMQGHGYQVDFGDVADTTNTASVYGTVYDDQNGNGVRDAGEPGIGGVTVTLDGLEMAAANTYGNYTFAVVAGSHSVVETDPAGYHSTTPNEIQLTVDAGSSYRVDFGDVSNSSNFASIYGTVYSDDNGNAQRDPGELGIPGVIVKLDGSNETATNIVGTYTFSTTVAGQHTVAETDPDGYSSTTPNAILLTVAAGHGYQADFGDMLTCTCLADSFEEDDTPAQAKLIQVGTAYAQTHNFCDDASDWLTFTASVGQVITITTSSSGQRADTNLALYAADGVTLLAGNDDLEGTQDYSSEIVWQPDITGSYYLHITNRAGLVCCSTEYTVTVESRMLPPKLYLPFISKSVASAPTLSGSLGLAPQSPAGIINHMCPDAYETDDSWLQAKPILPGIAQDHSFDSSPTLYAADKDVVWFDIMEGDTAVFSIEAVTNTLPLLELYDAAGNALGIGGTGQIELAAAASGRYYLSASPTTDAFGCAGVAGYVLKMDLKGLSRMYAPAIFWFESP